VLRRPNVVAARAEEGQRYFEQAIVLDPNFALAHARLAQIHTRIALFFDPSTIHRERGHTEAEEALRLQPQLSEGHVALGLYYGRLAREYNRALKEYEIARQSAPNDVQIVYGIAQVQMRQGQFRAAIANWERAVSLDPMNWNMLDNLANAYTAVGMFTAAERAARREMELVSDNSIEGFILAQHWGWTYVDLTGSFEKLNGVIAHYESLDDPSGAAALWTYETWMAQHDYDRAQRAIERSPASIFEVFNGPHATKNFLLGTIKFARGDHEKARPLFDAELPFARSELAEMPESPDRHAQLGLICAYLGRKEEAIAEGERAVELLPISKDAVDGPGMVLASAEIYARVGEQDKAVALLEKMMTVPNGATRSLLKNWRFDPLRTNPRLQAWLQGPPPKIVYN
jgi:serine/threonine-protein kinase